jgi:multiple antibiotic resistance protein
MTSSKFLVESFVTLLVIVDPIGNIPTFLAITKDRTRAARYRLAVQAVLTALGVIVIFAVFGRDILSYLGISLPALQVSGGLLLLIVALRLLSGDHNKVVAVEGVSVALVPLATPLIAGPGAIAAVLVFAGEVHNIAAAFFLGLSIIAVMVVLLVVLLLGTQVASILKRSGIEFLTRVFALLLAAIAIQLLADGVHGFGF